MIENSGLDAMMTIFTKWVLPKRNNNDSLSVQPQPGAVIEQPPSIVIPTENNRQIIDTPITQEITQKNVNLGLQFQDLISRLPESCLPPIFDGSGGAPAFLSTNEGIPLGLPEQVSGNENHPDGYIFGAGFGNILSLVSFFGEGKEPKAILSVDVLPEVVLMGRMMTQAMAESSDFNTFYRSIKNDEYLKKLYDGVMSADTPAVLRDRYSKVSFESLAKDIKDTHNREYVPKVGNDSGDVKKRAIVLASIRDNWQTLHHLAETGNIGIALGDITNQQTLDTVKNMPGFETDKNIIYMSNIIDHLTSRGTNLAQLNSMNPLASLGSGDKRGNWFIDTTQGSLDYQLRAEQELPQYTSADFNFSFRQH